MIYHFLCLANHGIDVLKIPDLPMIRSGLAGEGSDWPDHPVVHNILRLMRLISEIVCPGLLLAGVINLSKSSSSFKTVADAKEETNAPAKAPNAAAHGSSKAKTSSSIMIIFIFVFSLFFT